MPSTVATNERGATVARGAVAGCSIVSTLAPSLPGTGRAPLSGEAGADALVGALGSTGCGGCTLSKSAWLSHSLIGRAYAADLRDFEAWCARHGVPPYPLGPAGAHRGRLRSRPCATSTASPPRGRFRLCDGAASISVRRRCISARTVAISSVGPRHTMTVNGKGLATTWGECRALGLTLLGDAAWEIAVGDATAPSH